MVISGAHYPGLSPYRLLSLPVKEITVDDMDQVWQQINSLSERCEELEERVSFLEEDWGTDQEDLDDLVDTTPDQNYLDIPDLNEGEDFEFEGEVRFNEDNKPV